MKRIAITILSLVSLGCTIGQRVGSLSVAHQPGGARATIVERTGTISDVELLAVDDTGMVVLWSHSVGYLAFVNTSKFTSDAITVTLIDGGAPSHDEWMRLRLMSRFPQGLTPDLETRLLAAYHQRALVVLAQ